MGSNTESSHNIKDALQPSQSQQINDVQTGFKGCLLNPDKYYTFEQFIHTDTKPGLKLRITLCRPQYDHPTINLII